MTFTYTPDFATDRDNIRLRTGDTQTSAGPRPDKRNYSDEEIAQILSDEGATRNAAIAGIFEILTNEWSAYALSEKEGEVQFDAKLLANQFRKQAALWREKPGGATEAERSDGLIKITRTDAYTS